MLTIEARGAPQPGEWTIERQAAVVLRLLQGEPIDTLSQESQLPVEELRAWRRIFLEAGASALRAYERRAQKRLAEERRKKAREPARSEFAAVPDKDAGAANLPVPEHLHQLWVTLGLDNE